MFLFKYSHGKGKKGGSILRLMVFINEFFPPKKWLHWNKNRLRNSHANKAFRNPSIGNSITQLLRYIFRTDAWRQNLAFSNAAYSKISNYTMSLRNNPQSNLGCLPLVRKHLISLKDNPPFTPISFSI